jgi:hypothetical protein
MTAKHARYAASPFAATDPMTGSLNVCLWFCDFSGQPDESSISYFALMSFFAVIAACRRSFRAARGAPQIVEFAGPALSCTG